MALPPPTIWVFQDPNRGVPIFTSPFVRLKADVNLRIENRHSRHRESQSGVVSGLLRYARNDDSGYFRKGPPHLCSSVVSKRQAQQPTILANTPNAHRFLHRPVLHRRSIHEAFHP